MESNDPNKAARRRQLMVGGIIAAVVALAAVAVLATDNPVPRGASKKDSNTVLVDPRRDIKPEQEWITNATREMREMKDRLKKLEGEKDQLADQLKKGLSAQNKLQDELQKNTDDAKRVIDAQINEIDRLKSQADNQRSAAVLASPAAAPGQAAGDFVKRDGAKYGPGNALAGKTIVAGPNGSGIADIKLTLAKPKESKSTAKSLEHYVPAGAYAEARVISGVDATAGVVASSDPRPVLFRVRKAAITADHEGEEQTVDIEGCTVTGAAHGDLSSEKVYVRLQTLTCSYKAGTVIEKPVKAYVAGSGKAGVRGIVVSREGDYITTALISSVIGGFGRGLAEASAQTGSNLSSGITINQSTTSPSTGDIFQRGIGQGLSKGTDKIADYLIRRAEQYQPVIVMGAGQDVEIVFLEGVDLS